MSRLKVLRSLQVANWPTYPKLGDTRHTMVTEVFSDIASPAFSELVVVLGHYDIARLLSDVTLFETLRTMSEIRPFKLVLLFELHRFPARGTEERQKLTELLRLVATKRFFNSPPIIRWNLTI